MTVSSLITKVPYACDGVTIVFPITFPYFADTDIKVILRDADGNETPLVLNTDFEIPAEGEENEGNVVLIGDYEENPPASGVTLLIKRVLSLKQLFDFIPNDPFPAETLEELEDKQIMITQQLAEMISRAILLDETSSLSDLSIPEKDGDNRYIRWNSGGTGLEVAGGTMLDSDAIHDNIANEIAALTEKASPVANDVFLIEDSQASGVKKKVKWSALPGAGGGEANTASSQGTGTSIVYQKSGVDLQFNALKSENALLTIALDDVTHDVEFTINEGSIDHDNLANTHNLTTDIDHDSIAGFVAEEHIRWDQTGAENIHADRIAEGAVTQHQAALSITESQISDLDHYNSSDFAIDFAAADLADLGTKSHASLSDIGTNTHAQIDTHLALTDEHLDWTEDQGAKNIHANNITEGSVTQHQAALSITESQISDLGSYIENLIEDTTPQLGGSLDLNDKAIDFSGTLASNQTYEGFTLPITVSGLSFGQCVYISGNGAGSLADADAAATMPAIGLYVAENKIFTYGMIRNDSWSWTANQKIYVGLDGNPTNDISGYGANDQVQLIGIAYNATHIFVTGFTGISGY